ncbi:flagellar basal body rod protein FlgC [Crateriforma conspicua]|uniref:Flagellar basal-body rod protein FlgC n=1 Tax=Crateriforma conspicua TaxID=2527996 RepID=A0A5C5Y8Y8_9PLAN|nr:flagellar basal body rod protein FlgC [Crateriforma conspicua]QDV65883.1 Flagellar basal-body rod protein FlgC [Crateriforma conspicua]TWT71283.1 Flagellar basal-body rod protein FlgC [Crateriforma conspicua]
MISSLDISTSALVAQRTRLNAISGNIANMSSLTDETGAANPYKARQVVFQTDATVSDDQGVAGVKVKEILQDQSGPQYRYQPNHPLAIQDGKWKGYVAYPNIDLTTQMVDALETTRAYEANVGVIEISKNMGRERLTILA